MLGFADERPVVDDLVANRVDREALCQMTDLTVERRREHHRLALRRKHRKDLAHVGQETHIEHPVGFVEHRDAYAIELHEPPVDEVDQAAGCRDDDIRLCCTLALILKANPATVEIPIVALTAHARPEDRQAALDAGCVEYISKPIDTRTLPTQLAAVLREFGTGS